MTQEEKTIKTEVIHEGIITDYVIKTVELPNGKTATREIVLHDDASAIIPFTDDGKVLFVKQFRKPIEQSIYEIPAGLIDDGEDDPLTAAKRELEEETGYQAESWQKVAGFYVSPGFTNEYLTLYRADNLIKLENPLAQDSDENIELTALTLDEAMEKHEMGLINDAKTVFALHYWKNLEG